MNLPPFHNLPRLVSETGAWGEAKEEKGQKVWESDSYCSQTNLETFGLQGGRGRCGFEAILNSYPWTGIDYLYRMSLFSKFGGELVLRQELHGYRNYGLDVPKMRTIGRLMRLTFINAINNELERVKGSPGVAADAYEQAATLGQLLREPSIPDTARGKLMFGEKAVALDYTTIPLFDTIVETTVGFEVRKRFATGELVRNVVKRRLQKLMELAVAFDVSVDVVVSSGSHFWIYRQQDANALAGIVTPATGRAREPEWKSVNFGDLSERSLKLGESGARLQALSIVDEITENARGLWQQGLTVLLRPKIVGGRGGGRDNQARGRDPVAKFEHMSAWIRQWKTCVDVGKAYAASEPGLGI